jgi:hypothetical protein
MPVETPRKEYEAMLERWTRCRDCYEGSDAVKARGQKYLPALASHQKNMLLYFAYVMRALFFNAMARTVDALAGAIFQKPPMIVVPKSYEKQLADVTLTGEPMEMFSLKAAREVLKVGRAGVLVDMAAEEKGKKASEPARPYLVNYRAEDIVGWGTIRIEGDSRLALVVLHEVVEANDPKDPFMVLSLDQYRVLMLEGEVDSLVYKQQLWRKPEGSDQFVIAEETNPARRGTPLDFVPFMFINATSIAPAIEKPPLLDLADVNLSHYRTSADLEHGRHFTALPTPWISGSIAGDSNEELAIGSGVAWQLEKDGSAGMLEFSGAGLGALVTADQEKRKMMATLGARMLEDVAVAAETATAVRMRHSGEGATLRTIAAVLEQGLTQVLQWLVWWQDTTDKPQEVKASLELNKEFFNLKADATEVQAALAALQAETISYATFYNRLAEGGWARSGVTADEERKEIEADREYYQSLAPSQPAETETPKLGPDGKPLPPGTPPAEEPPAEEEEEEEDEDEDEEE